MIALDPFAVQGGLDKTQNCIQEFFIFDSLISIQKNL